MSAPRYSNTFRDKESGNLSVKRLGGGRKKKKRKRKQSFELNSEVDVLVFIYSAG